MPWIDIAVVCVCVCVCEYIYVTGGRAAEDIEEINVYIVMKFFWCV